MSSLSGGQRLAFRRASSDPTPMKQANKTGKPVAESVERRPGVKGNRVRLHTDRTQGRVSVSQRLDPVRQAARLKKKERFTALFHYLDIYLLRESFFWLQRKLAAGLDGVMWWDYEEDLENKLVNLHDRLRRGAYRALPSRRRSPANPAAIDTGQLESGEAKSITASLPMGQIQAGIKTRRRKHRRVW
jgi:hypothetical protein